MRAMVLRIIMVVSLMILSICGAVWAESPSQTSFGNLTVDYWVGHNFIFLPLPADKQAEGYEVFAEEQLSRGLQGDRAARIPYAEYFAKQIRITKVVATGDRVFDYIVYMTEIATGKKLAGRTIRGQLEGVALATDLGNARKQFVGHTIYTKNMTLTGVYDPLTKQTPVSLTISLGTPLAVVDVWDGLCSSEPIWLVVLVNGQKAALPIAFSWTNQPTDEWSMGAPWQQVLFLEKPGEKAGWSQEDWNLVSAGDVKEGMSKDQVRLSWGNPVRVDENNTTTATWYYGNSSLQFTGNTVSAIVKVALKDSVTP
ncbi:MAG: hypothetical protein P4N59_24640 [Negativicutes bacterium]|nr:hypothetical protein [Negativicutes bacterium]